jgi:signal transduction histidine kinase
MAPNSPLSVLTSSNVFVRYSAALLALLIALALGRAMGPSPGDFVPVGLGFLALAFSGWYCGVGPSLVVTVLALTAFRYWLISPVHMIRIVTSASAFELLVLVVISAAIIAMGESRSQENRALRRAQKDLEDCVKQRTVDLDAANRGLRELTARLMQLQDEERRRIARELHDSVGQTLAALTMNLTTVSADIERLGQTAKTVSDSLALAHEMNKEVRTVSYLLHPPLLDEAGLASALRWYVEGFTERSKIQVQLEIVEDFGRLPQDVETALFRTVQECLTNIHRHSGSPVASIRLALIADQIRLRVEDRGLGIPREKLAEVISDGTPGVGIRGMRERMRQLGGSLTIQSSENCTVVEVSLPMVQLHVLPAPEIAA